MTLILPVTPNEPRQLNLLQTLSPSPHLRCRLVSGRPVVSGLYQESNRVPDVVRYVIDLTSDTPDGASLSPPERGDADLISHDGFSGDVRADQHRAKHERIVLILESPHKHEYTQDFTPIAPAQGSTGWGIRDYIIPLLYRHQRLELPPSKYELLICNPVQFQASLYELHREELNDNEPAQQLRNTTWRTLYYGMNERAHFLRRLDGYNAAAVIVACTAALRQEVLSDVLRWPNGWVPIVEASHHPCAWQRNISRVTFA
ncbi:hypothetical protein MEBOL_003852 [Melittangium boletus DSM 14713]|uniref:Uncharacterized protein n=1 Tax=Melittangium boletus DSM 14713 TaxID=1294270 RepID=A0A250IGV7_9BACT|nr:hypothetical protein MEBOL_003852 [Melittangium boletus DSM 14713]